MARKKSESWDATADREASNGGHLDGLETPPRVVKTATPIMLPQLDIRTLEITLVGESPLICHRWSEKAKKEMLDKQMGTATSGKAKKDPESDFWESLYHMEEGQTYPHRDGYRYGFPTIGFKNAAVTACTSLGKAITKVSARQAFHVIGELTEVFGTPRPREDMVRLGGSVADIRFRAEFPTWRVAIQVRYNARLLTDQQIINLFNTAGFAVGCGEWRPEKDGQFGMFRVA